MTLSKSASVIVETTAPSFHLTSWESRTIPALFTRTSTRPKRDDDPGNGRSRRAAASATSTFRPSASGAPAALSSETSAAAPASSTSHADTAQPLAGEAQGRGAADAGRTTGDDGNAHGQNVTLTPTWNSRAGRVAE